MLDFCVKNQIMVRRDSFLPVSDSKNYLKASFEFSEEWQGEIVAIFGDADNNFYEMILKGNQCLVPWEVIKAPFFTVSVFCGDLVTANVVRVDVEKSGYNQGETPSLPTPDIYNQILTLSKGPYIGENGNWYTWDKEKGEFLDSGKASKGDRGEKGDKGEKGDTPMPDVVSEIPEVLSANTIYDLGVQSSLELTLPSGVVGDFIQVDFLSGSDAPSLTINSPSGLSDLDLVPEKGMIYSLYFDWGVLYYDNDKKLYAYGWRFAYAEHLYSEV